MNKNIRFKVKLKGRLGNQMFQYSFGYSLSRYYNCELYIERNSETKLDTFFSIKIEKENYIWNKKIQENIHYKKNDEKKFENLDFGNYLIDGYWQSENLFKQYKKEIKSIFKLPKYNIPKNNLIVHVRRGDYVNNPNFYSCDLEWYKKVISLCKFEQLHIVSDDPNWCKKNFAEYSPIIPSLNELDTLGYISSFNNIIISNSTFSWWAAYLSNASNIFCPLIWSPNLYRSFNPALDSYIKV